MITVAISCSKRKRVAPAVDLRGRSLRADDLESVAAEWTARVSSASRTVKAARELYCGRHFNEALSATSSLKANLLVISAGLGALIGDEPVTPYSLTVSRGAEDCVFDVVQEKCTPADWWRAIVSQSGRIRGLRATLAETTSDLLLMAMPSSYLRMVEPELEQFRDGEISRIRVFTAPSFRFSNDRLRRVTIPYDSRLDGPDSPIAGTATDFSARALRDFATAVLSTSPDGDADDHARAVSDRLQNWRMPVRQDRQSQTDEQLLAIIRANWRNAGGSASQMLRYVRSELGLACEQARMRGLYNRVCSEMEELS